MVKIAMKCKNADIAKMQKNPVLTWSSTRILWCCVVSTKAEPAKMPRLAGATINKCCMHEAM